MKLSQSFALECINAGPINAPLLLLKSMAMIWPLGGKMAAVEADKTAFDDRGRLLP